MHGVAYVVLPGQCVQYDVFALCRVIIDLATAPYVYVSVGFLIVGFVASSYYNGVSVIRRAPLIRQLLSINPAV